VAAASSPFVYLDHAATTPVRPEVREAMDRAAAEAWANPSSPHAAGRRAKHVLEECREAILALVGGRTTGTARDRLVFTSGATEANRLAILGLAAGATGVFATSARDHTSVRNLRSDMVGRGWVVVEPPLEGTGRITPDWPFPACGRGIWATTLVCGQSGAVEDLPRIAALLRPRPDVLLHVDATQAVVTQPIVMPDLGAATLTLAPHKFAGPRGIGAVVVRGDVGLVPLVPGPQEAGLRGGTEPVILAVGFARALELAVAERAAMAVRLADLRDRFARAFTAQAGGRGLSIEPVVAASDASPHILTVALTGVDRQAFVMAADLAGVCCGTGTACASGSSEPSPALTSMGLSPGQVAAAVRFSFGQTTSETDVAAAVTRLEPVLERLAAHARESCRQTVD
jgi:cysteine desulfurase